jgi:GTP-dependent phosphoenolpyruvate carboxykinase
LIRLVLATSFAIIYPAETGVTYTSPAAELPIIDTKKLLRGAGIIIGAIMFGGSTTPGVDAVVSGTTGVGVVPEVEPKLTETVAAPTFSRPT